MRWRKLLTPWYSLQLCLIAAAMPLAASAQPSLPAALPEDILPGLKPLIEQATRQSPSMMAASLAIAQAEAYAYTDRSGLWPSVSGYGRYQQTRSAVSADTNSNTKATGPLYGVSINQPIYQWGALRAQADIGVLRTRIAERQYAEVYRLLVLSLRGQYLAAIQKKVMLRNLHVVLKATESALTLQKARLREGRISAGDIDAPRLLVDQARLNAEQAQEAYEASRRTLARLAGAPDISDELIPLDIPKPTFARETVGAYFEQMKPSGADNTIMLSIFLDSIRQSELTYKIAKTRLYPKFLVAASYDQQSQTSIQGEGAERKPILTTINTTSLYIGANWTIFDGFATRGAKLSALAAKRLSEHQLKTFKETTVETAQALEKQIGFTGRMMDLTDTRKALSDAAVTKVGNDVESGVSPQTLLDSVTQTANDAELAVYEARAEFLSYWAEYVSILGADPALHNLSPRYLRNGK